MTSELYLRARNAMRGAMAAAALNVVGMPIDYMIGRATPTVPLWPNVASALVGAALLVLLLARRKQPSVTLGSAAFLVNTAAIVTALVVAAPHYAGSTKWVPFQANKLGALTVPLLMPELWVGVLGVLAFSGSAVIQYGLFAPEIRQRIPFGEPWASVAFGVFGLVLTAYRWRWLETERSLARAQAEAAALDRMAHTLLAVRDLSNTPLQTIQFIVGLLGEQHPELAPLLERMKGSLTALRDLNQILKSHESALRWRPEDASFDSITRIAPKRDKGPQSSS
jgi:hypothetical protein